MSIKHKMICYMIFLVGCSWIALVIAGKIPVTSLVFLPILGGAGFFTILYALDFGD